MVGIEDTGGLTHDGRSGGAPEVRSRRPDNYDLFFSAENWTLRKLVDKSRVTNEKTVQVFWLSSNGPRKYVGKVFPDYTKEQAR
ncbi:hypothetical protein DTO169E5_3649 [Paecilomyces variotii]|nr:hypothetical protein DTO169E5_3649 [Paecilomyces variotii]